MCFALCLHRQQCTEQGWQREIMAIVEPLSFLSTWASSKITGWSRNVTEYGMFDLEKTLSPW